MYITSMIWGLSSAIGQRRGPRTVRISFGEVPASATLPHVYTAQRQGAGKETDGDHRLPCTVTSLARRGPKKRRCRGMGRDQIVHYCHHFVAQ